MSSQSDWYKKYSVAQEVIDQIDGWISKYPINRHRSALIPALRILQDYNGGWLSENLINFISEYLKIPLIDVKGVASFYSMFDLQPVGKYKICICTNLSCKLANGNEIIDFIKNKLKIDFSETTQDKLFTLKAVECLGDCVNGPCCYINNKHYSKLTIDKINDILIGLK